MHYTKQDHVVSVGEGFTWWGFVFVWGWLLSRGLWIRGFLVMLFYLPTYFFSSVVLAALMKGVPITNLYLFVPTLVLIVTHVYIGFKGNSWKRLSLTRKGYKPI